MSGKYEIPDEFLAVHNKLYGVLKETDNKQGNIKKQNFRLSAHIVCKKHHYFIVIQINLTFETII